MSVPLHDILSRLTQLLFVLLALAAGQVLASTDARGNSSFYGYDAAGRSVALTNALSFVTRYPYDELGRQLTQTDANTIRWATARTAP